MSGNDLPPKVVIPMVVIGAVFAMIAGYVIGSVLGAPGSRVEDIKRIWALEDELQKLKSDPQHKIKTMEYNKMVMEDEARLQKIFRQYSGTNVHHVFTQSRVTDLNYVLFIKGGEFIGMQRVP